MSDHPWVSETIHRKEVGRRLRAAIEAKGISQADVERALGASASKLGNWLRGDHYPSAFFVKLFCDRYGVTSDWIYRGIVSGMDRALADALWKTEHAAPENYASDNDPAAPATNPEGRTPTPPFFAVGSAKGKPGNRLQLVVVPQRNCPVADVERR